MTERYDVIGCHITAATHQSACDRLVARVREGGGGYVCFVNSHVAVTAHEDAVVRTAVNASFMSLPDGRPIYIVGRLRGIDELESVPGPDFFEAMLALRTDPPLRHYFLGGREEVLDVLLRNIRNRYPAAEIAGAYSPPFRPLDDAEWDRVIGSIRGAAPDLIWVGLGAPKQELFMHHRWDALKPAVLLGVGAAFDFLAGSVRRAPAWMRRLGMEWLYRLACEPGRLWKRYFYTNTMFLVYAAAAVVGLRRGHDS